MRRALVLISFAFIAAAPRVDIPRFTGETVEVSIVNVDVFVTDKAGNRVKGLTKDDFIITEDKKPQAITNFAEYSGALSKEKAGVEGTITSIPGATEAPAVSASSGRPRTVIVFIDDLQLNRRNRDSFFDTLKDTIHKTVRPGDSVMVLRWGFMQGLQTRQAFTDDLSRVDGALDKIGEEVMAIRVDPVTTFRRRAYEVEQFEKGVAAQSGTPIVPAGSDADPILFDARLSARQAFFEQKQKTAALTSVLGTVSGVEGKKVMILASHRMSSYPGGEFFYAVGTSQLPDRDRNELDGTKLTDAVTRAANASGVTLYTLFPEGLGKAGLAGADEMRDINDLSIDKTSSLNSIDFNILNNESPVLSQMAKQTGGLFSYGPDTVKLLPRLVDDFESYYSMAYSTTTRNQDRARNLIVRAKNPEYTIRSRRQYVEKSDETRMGERVVATLLDTMADRSLIDIQARVGTPRRGAKDRYLVPVSIRIPVKSLTTVPQMGANAGAFSVYLAWGSLQGDVSDVNRRTQPFTIKPGDVGKVPYFTYDVELVVDSKTDRVAVGVYDEVSRDFGLQRIELHHGKV